MKQNRIILFTGKQTTRHYLECIKILEQNYRWQVNIVTIHSEIADLARNILQVDRVFLLKRLEFPFVNNNGISLQEVIEITQPNLWMIVGNLDSKFTRAIRQTNLPVIWIHTTKDNLEARISNDSIQEIIPDIISQVAPKSHMVHVPEPCVNYTDFLDLDTTQVLEWRTDHNLISYKQNSIQKKYLVGVLADQRQEEILLQLIEEQEMAMYSISGRNKSHVNIPEITEQNAAIIFELCDTLIIIDDNHPDLIITTMRAMASGTIIIAPRTEFFLSLLGKGALYYKPNSMGELQACLEILARSEQKRQEVRQVASLLFEKRYSYKAITRLWNTVLDYAIQ